MDDPHLGYITKIAQGKKKKKNWNIEIFKNKNKKRKKKHTFFSKKTTLWMKIENLLKIFKIN